jgi:uncharacterized protein (TIGR02300 family)
VAKAELGMKLTCDSCGARFYDLNKQPGICPKCGTGNTRPVIFKASRTRADESKRAPVAVKAPPKPAPAEADAPEAADDEEDEAVIEDTSDLGEDDDVEVPVEKDEAP